MNISVSQLPSGGYGYQFPSVSVKPMSFLEVVEYVDGLPKGDSLGRYLYDVETLVKDDVNIKNCYIMDVDFLIFYKKLCTVSEDLTYQLDIRCPHCGQLIKKRISFESDIHFKQVDEKIMGGANIELGGHKYSTIVPTVSDFMRVFNVYMRYKKVTDIKMIKTIALMKDFDYQGNQIEADVLGATHNDITLLMALRDLYYDNVLPVTFTCPECAKLGERREISVSVDTLITDFFRDLYVNSPIDATKILFK